MSDRRETDTLEIDPQDVEGREPSTSGVGLPDEVKKPEGTEAETLRETRRTIKEQRLALKESNEAARYWMEQARANNGAAAKPAEAETEPSTSVDLVEAITNGDAKAITQAMRDLGFVRKGEVESVVAAGTRSRSTEEDLYKRFPDLKDEESDLFKTTAEVYNDLKRRDPSLAKSGLLAEIAAEIADKRLGNEPARGRRAAARDGAGARGEDEFDDEPDDEEEERVSRVRRQTGDRGSRSSRGQDRGGSDELDKTQKTIVARLKAIGADITEDGYRKRATAGVRMSGLPTRRARF